MPNNIAGSETCLLVVRVIKLSQNIKQTGSFEKVRDNLLQRGENKYFWYQLAFSCQVCVGQSVHLLLSSVVLTSLHIVCWKEPAARGGWRWCLHGVGGVAPRCLWGLPCVPQAGDIPGQEQGGSGAVGKRWHAHTCPASAREAPAPARASGTPQRQCQLHIWLGWPWKKEQMAVCSFREAKCLLKWALGGGCIYRRMATVLCWTYWRFSNYYSRNIHLEDIRNSRSWFVPFLFKCVLDWHSHCPGVKSQDSVRFLSVASSMTLVKLFSFQFLLVTVVSII